MALALPLSRHWHFGNALSLKRCKMTSICLWSPSTMEVQSTAWRAVHSEVAVTAEKPLHLQNVERTASTRHPNNLHRNTFIKPLNMASRDETQKLVVDQLAQLKVLRAGKAPKETLDAGIANLKSLQARIKEIDDESGENNGDLRKFTLKTAKGTKDYTPEEMSLREGIFGTIIGVFKSHGAVTIDTPVFELKEILAGKYGEDSKLIYDLQDQGGELCSLRYDLTVPFARFLAMNAQYGAMKRYHIAKVYRRDQPSVAKGRMREFYQCDFDIAGPHDPMIPDSEILHIMSTVLRKLEIGEFTVKVNHRKILDGIFEACGVPADKFRGICSAVDKLDKSPWAEVRKEMTEQKGLDLATAERIGTYVQLKSTPTSKTSQTSVVDLIARLGSDELLMSNASFKQGFEEMQLLFRYLNVLGVEKISFDLSLARGLDYYTGVIYEAVFDENEREKQEAANRKKKDFISVGSIAGGGRYDKLVGMFSGGKKIPCVGFSVGVERIFSILMAKKKNLEGLRANETQVFVCGLGDGMVEERLKICSEFWSAGIKASTSYKVKPKLQQQFNQIEREGVPFAVLIGPEEVEQGFVKVKDMNVMEGEEKSGVLISRSHMIMDIKKRLGL